MNLAWSVVADCKREFNSLGRRVYSCLGGNIIWQVIYSNVFNSEIPKNLPAVARDKIPIISGGLQSTS